MLGAGLRHARIAVCGVAAVAGAVERLAGCRAVRWWIADDAILAPAHPLVRGGGAAAGAPAGPALAAALQAHNAWETGWEFRHYPALTPATLAPLAAAWRTEPPDLLLGGGDAATLALLVALARSLDVPALLVAHYAGTDPSAGLPGLAARRRRPRPRLARPARRSRRAAPGRPGGAARHARRPGTPGPRPTAWPPCWRAPCSPTAARTPRPLSTASSGASTAPPPSWAPLPGPGPSSTPTWPSRAGDEWSVVSGQWSVATSRQLLAVSPLFNTQHSTLVTRSQHSALSTQHSSLGVGAWAAWWRGGWWRVGRWGGWRWWMGRRWMRPIRCGSSSIPIRSGNLKPPRWREPDGDPARTRGRRTPSHLGE